MSAGSDESTRLMLPVPQNRFDVDSDSDERSKRLQLPLPVAKPVDDDSDSASSWLKRERSKMLKLSVTPQVIDSDSDSPWGDWLGKKRFMTGEAGFTRMDMGKCSLYDDREVSLLVPPHFSLVESQPSGTGFTPAASSSTHDESFRRAPATPTVVDDPGTRAPFIPQFGMLLQSPGTPTVVDESMTRAPSTPKSGYELACERAAI